jgi:hypothetical protein
MAGEQRRVAIRAVPYWDPTKLIGGQNHLESTSPINGERTKKYVLVEPQGRPITTQSTRMSWTWFLGCDVPTMGRPCILPKSIGRKKLFASGDALNAMGRGRMRKAS